MLKVLKYAAIIFILIYLAIVIAGAIASSLRHRKNITSILETGRGAAEDVIREDDITHLPGPVQRYLKFSGVLNRRPVQSVRLFQKGSIRRGPGQPWMDFDAVEYFNAAKPSLLWLATIPVAPGISMHVADSLMDGKGKISVTFNSFLPLGETTGNELDQGVVLRFLNETMWFPSALLSHYIRWENIDGDSARATITVGDVTASAVYMFDNEGMLVNFIAERYREVNGTFELRKWSTPITEYGEFDGIRVPVRGNGVWHLDSGEFVYVKISVDGIEYDPAEL